MGIFSGLFDTSKNDKEEKEIKRLKNLGLSDEEARLVREEGWDETSFEDDPDMEVEDDDYYGEDDFIDPEEDEDEWV
jgi:hypothetical protein